jgi:hypothetical protein
MTTGRHRQAITAVTTGVPVALVSATMVTVIGSREPRVVTGPTAEEAPA